MDKLASQEEQDLSIKQERKVARTFIGRIEWEMIAIGLGQCAIWVTVWVLVVQALFLCGRGS